jgi:hypothetical protein
MAQETVGFFGQIWRLPATPTADGAEPERPPSRLQVEKLSVVKAGVAPGRANAVYRRCSVSPRAFKSSVGHWRVRRQHRTICPQESIKLRRSRRHARHR